jgi:hypothetical protein
MVFDFKTGVLFSLKVVGTLAPKYDGATPLIFVQN